MGIVHIVSIVLVDKKIIYSRDFIIIGQCVPGKFYFPNIYYDRFFGPTSPFAISNLIFSTEQPTISSNFGSNNIPYSDLFEYKNNIDDDNSSDVDKKTSEEKKVNDNNDFDLPTSKQTSSPSNQPRTPASKRTPLPPNNTDIVLFSLFDSNQNNFSTFTVGEGISIFLDHFAYTQQQVSQPTITRMLQNAPVGKSVSSSNFLNFSRQTHPSCSYLSGLYNCHLIEPIFGHNVLLRLVVPFKAALLLLRLSSLLRSQITNANESACMLIEWNSHSFAVNKFSSIYFLSFHPLVGPSGNENLFVPQLYAKNSKPCIMFGKFLTSFANSTRPELYFIVITLSRYVTNPGYIHWLAAVRVLVYVISTPLFGIIIKIGQNFKLTVYVDSDHAGNTDDRKSISGCIIYLGSTPILWRARRQKGKPAVSSCEAGYIPLSACINEIVWIVSFLSELGFASRISYPIPIYCDNKSAKDLAYNPVHHDRAKHIDIRYHRIREFILDDTVVVKYVKSEENPATLVKFDHVIKIKKYFTVM